MHIHDVRYIVFSQVTMQTKVIDRDKFNNHRIRDRMRNEPDYYISMNEWLMTLFSKSNSIIVI